MPAFRLRIFLELLIDVTERAASIIRRHSCAWHAVSDSQARSSGSGSRPSGVIRRSPIELNHAAISSLAGDRGRRQEPSQRHSHCYAEPTKAQIRRILNFA